MNAKPGTPSTANALGALALALVDRMGGAIGAGGPAPAAIVTLHTWPGLTIGDLARIMKLSHPGAVRLVDRLVEHGWVERRGLSDARAVALHLTPAGREQRLQVVNRRQGELERLVKILSPPEQRHLHTALMKLLHALPHSLEDALSICRLCKTESCVAHGCPVEQGCLAAIEASGSRGAPARFGAGPSQVRRPRDRAGSRRTSPKKPR